MMRTVTEIDIQRPELLIFTDDSASSECLRFNGSYSLTSNLLYSKSDDVSVYMRLQRSDDVYINATGVTEYLSSYDIHLSLLESSGDYETIFKTLTPIVSPSNIASETYFTNLFVARDNVYVLTTNDTLVSNCTISFGITGNYEEPTINDPYPLTAANYSQNAIPGRYNHARTCNWHRGRLNENRLLFYPNCLAEEECGGDVMFVYPGVSFDLPVYVPVDVTTSFRLDCVEFYAPNTTFYDFADNLIYRDSFNTGGCNAPFILNGLIEAPTRTNEKFIQCHKRGGLLSSTETFCTRSVTFEYCQLGWFYHDQYCYYRFDSVAEVSYNTDPDACVNLFALSEKVQSIDVYLKAILETEFVFWKFNPEKEIIYRANVNSQFCLCFSATSDESFRCSCDIYDIDGVLIFPICRYSIEQPGVLPKYFGTSMSMQTARTITKGQTGPKHSGHPASCKCKDVSFLFSSPWTCFKT